MKTKTDSQTNPKSLSLQNICIDLNVIHRNIDIKYYKYNFRHLKMTFNNYGMITIPKLF